MADMDNETVPQKLYNALAYAVSGDTERAFELINAVGSSCDVKEMYGVCGGIAETGALMLRKIYGDNAPQSPEDGMWTFEELRPGAGADDPPKLFSMRFLIAWANGDRDTTLALYDTALKAGPDAYTESVCALFADVVGITKLALEQKDKPS